MTERTPPHPLHSSSPPRPSLVSAGASRTPRRRKLAGLAAALTAAVWAMPACNILGPASYLVLGPEKVQKVYELDPNRPTVIFVDDRVPHTSRPDRRLIGQTAEELLLNEEVVAQMISSQGAQEVGAGEAFGEPASIAEIGRAVKAEVVIYATIDEFTLSTDGQSYSPRASVRVKVVDAVEGHAGRLWPTDGDGWYRLVVQPVQGPALRPSSPGEQTQARRLFAQQVGRDLAGLFYDHLPAESKIKGTE